MKRPAFQFYPSDWMKSADLRTCTVGARGLWIDMICLMHDGAPYGFLKVGEKVILPANLARIVGATAVEVEGWIAELEEAAVFSRNSEGCIFSRRMIRDEKVREARASGGKLGGNPALMDKSKVAGKVEEKVNLTANLQPTPSSSSSVSPSERDDTSHTTSKDGSDPIPKKSSAGRSPPKSPKKEPAGPHPESLRAFQEFWKARYGESYSVDYQKDGTMISWMLKNSDSDAAKLRATFQRFFASDDAFVLKRKHSLGELRRQFNEFKVGKPTKPASASSNEATERIIRGDLAPPLPMKSPAGGQIK